MVDSIGTNKRELAVVTKVLDLYDSKNPKTTYLKSVVADVPGKGIKITRYVANTDKKPEDDEQFNTYGIMQVMKLEQMAEIENKIFVQFLTITII